ncbi:Esterase/lipase/thioesterase family active site [Hyphomicrobium sulfonivorans]|uniref:Esterase/lipase/thioesterase family active site n=1 Tax=Hyphomicrobium sulfonivorans TaxID=121290 RepID=A0A109BLC3_HYPSL|nr:alpha/beta family hydrolase [Hyphomicrobium sulfonivorans]KWT70097.1 Esterase/lipase/thioesterase family active site [Hyphomicrobium sulfonivorans]
MINFLTAGSDKALAHILLAHGAGAPMTSPYLDAMSDLLCERGLQVSRFEFEYMAARRDGGKRKPPPRADRLTTEYLLAVEALHEQTPALKNGKQRLIIGGKSMGGRVASMVAQELYAAQRISGLVCLGYPFHPPAKPENLRTVHLRDISCPTLIVQGERDPFGTRAEVNGTDGHAGYDLSPAIEMVWIADGDHDFAPRRGSGFTRAGNLALAADAVAAFAMPD